MIPVHPRCICLAGVDGAGKSTQARALAASLREQGVQVRTAWLRFPHLTCAPLLAYARWRGYSRRERVEGYEHGYWDFGRSWVMSTLFPWLLLLDAAIVALSRVFLPLAGGATVLCDRCVVDTLVDLMAGLEIERYDERMPGQLFFALLPRGSAVVVLDLDTATCCQRSPELNGDRTHGQRRALYQAIARRHGLPLISTRPSVQAVNTEIMELIYGSNRLSGFATG